MAAFESFVILAGMRTGSNFLEANLNALAGVTCHGEVFNPQFIGHKGQESLFGIDLAGRAADPLALLARMTAETAGLAGFRLFFDHDPRVLAHCLADRGCAKIVLTRNPVDSYVSLLIAAATGQWRLGDLRHHRGATVRFDAAGFEAHLAAQQGFLQHILNALQQGGQTAFWLGYEDLGDLAVLGGLAAWLGVAGRLEALDGGLKRQNPEPVRDRVENPAEMEAALARLDRFNLWRTPAFEPRRGPGVPGFVAAPAAPLLFLPVRGGPEAEVASWLAALDGEGPGAARTGFTQKTLRLWQRDHPGFRSFAVLRHPLARAHAAYCAAILAGALGEVRRVLRTSYRLPIPAGDVVAGALPPGYGREEHRAGFLAFLRFLKGNLAGQTSVRVDPLWASQAAVIRGMAEIVIPDRLLREEGLTRGLADLAAEVGRRAPPLPAPPAAGTPPVPLAVIADAELEAAAREAYGRDYQTFGFTDLPGPAPG
ncbi:MAG: nodulation protein NodH [Rhodobacteraceae bacterium]|nr:nodulation protein NodH [Paracoccaceae bacterium]